MIKVIIDDIEFESLSNVSVAMSFDAKAMYDLDSARDAVDVEVEIAPTSTDTSLFGGEGYLHVAERFNAVEHLAKICYESVVVFEGAATMRAAKRSGDGVVYTIRIRREGAEWAESAATELLSELPVEYQTYLTEYNISQSWYNADMVKYFPVHRDSYSEVYSSVSSDVVHRVLSIDEYHPFINLYQLLNTIFTNAGYSVQSSFLESVWFKRLYMSGAYTSQKSETAATLMDFYVTKLEDVSSTADFRGRVSMTPYVASSTVGNFVDVESIDSSSGCYSRSSCLAEVDGVLCFTPLSQVSVGFEYRFRYLTEYQIKSRTELLAFDTFYLESGGEINVGVANKFVDQRYEDAISNFEYTIVAFDHEDSYSYKLYVYENRVELTTLTWDTQSTTFTSPTYSDPSSVTYMLLKSTNGGDSYLASSVDWALYQGYVPLNGETEVDVTIRTSPETISPSSPKSFGGHYVSGAEWGMKFTLLAGTTLTPYFASYPGVGASVEFEDVSQLGIYQSRVISAVQHLFNLRFFTDKTAKKLYIEPLEQLYDSFDLWDWTDKIVEGEQIIYEDVANDLYKTRRWAYQQSDGASTRAQEFGYEPSETYPDAPEENPTQSYDGSWSTEYGSWSVEIGNYGAKNSISSTLNPLFSPTMNDTNEFPIVGDREDAELVDTLEFSPRVVAYIRTQSYDNETVPYTTFHAPDENFTLCFEDRDGVVGLNKYYQDQVSRDAVSQYVTLSLRLSPFDISALLSPVDGAASVMSTFAFEIDGEWCDCRMESMLSYDLGSGVALCKFLIVG